MIFEIARVLHQVEVQIMKKAYTKKDLQNIKDKAKMKFQEIEIRSQHSCADLWKYISNFNLIGWFVGSPNESLPKIENSSINEMLIVQKNMMGEFEQRWEWEENRFLHSMQIYFSGPVKFFEFFCTLKPQPDGSTLILISSGVVGFWGIKLLCKLLSNKVNKGMVKYITMIDNILSRRKNNQEAYVVQNKNINNIDDTAISLLTQKFEKIYNFNDAKKLAKYIILSPEVVLNRIKPFELADYLGLEKFNLLEFMLKATKVGYFDMSWQILCPNCRMPAVGVSKLSAMKNISIHCLMCNLKSKIEYSQNVELIFCPTKEVRSVDSKIFCTSSPSYMPHFIDQFIIDPLENRNISIELPTGIYSFRSIKTGSKSDFFLANDFIFRVDNNSEIDTLNINLEDKTQVSSEVVSPKFNLNIKNENCFKKFNILHLSEFENAATLDKVSSLQSYKELYELDVFPNDIELGASSLAFIFTDLKGSTKMYSEIGDAASFMRVKAHFDVLETIIKKHKGAIVKTIGDAVMGVFKSVQDAFLASIEIQENFIHDPDLKKLILRIGLHYGPCLVVNANGKIDYFGNTVNITSRINHHSQGEDIVLSANAYRAVIDLIKNTMQTETQLVELRGIYGIHNIYRLTFEKCEHKND